MGCLVKNNSGYWTLEFLRLILFGDEIPSTLMAAYGTSSNIESKRSIIGTNWNEAQSYIIPGEVMYLKIKA